MTLLVYDTHRDVAFSSAERPPALDPGLAARALEASRRGEGVWTTLEVDGVPQHAYVFATADLVYALAYPRLSPGRYAADLVEAVVRLHPAGRRRPRPGGAGALRPAAGPR